MSDPVAGIAQEEVLTEKQRLRKERADQKKAEKELKLAAKKGVSNVPSSADKPAPKKTNKNAPVADGASSSKSKDDGPRLKKEYSNPVPKGEKKPVSCKIADMPKEYDPPFVESAWYDWWEKEGYFHAPEGPDDGSEKFVIVIPPPNVTGILHIGHALTNSIQDVLCRWHRMNGKTVLWVPGTDHAGIATQDVVEKRLIRSENKDRHAFGRVEFINKVWEWKEQYGAQICTQLRRLGSSLDWKRQVFTLDEKLSRAVIEAFIKLYDSGFIYREKRLVNWCCKLNTAISDIEVDTLELTGPTKIPGHKLPGHRADAEYDFGVLFQFAYKVDGEDSELVVATTRLETMLGDTAVAIHPDDERYKCFHGKFVVHPFNGKKLPIICDEHLVKMGFGTGCVKITPAHDPNDYICGVRHKLEFITILHEDGTINCNAPVKYQGKMRFDVRQELIIDMQQLGIYRGTLPNPMNIGICSRTGDIIEPMIKPQWWVRCQELAARAATAVRTGELEIIPKSHERDWFKYMEEDIRDWCISRQLWWGHRIPAFQVLVNGSAKENEWIIARSVEEALEKAKAKYIDVENITLEQDPDVLDTWFSSGIFPFSVFGWPEQTLDLQRYYPTSLLETGHDILFFWVARMVMMGTQLTGKLPFKQVYLHALVKDAYGRKMSKSKGNIINPIDVIEGITLETLNRSLQTYNLPDKEMEKAIDGQKQMFPKGISECGTDAMRFALCNFCALGNEIHLNIPVVVTYRNFCNKIWNLLRYSMGKWGDNYNPEPTIGPLGHDSTMDLWLWSRLSSCIEEVHRGFTIMDFSIPTNALHSFFLKDICQVYCEIMRPVLSLPEVTEEKRAGLNALYNAIELGLRLLHPFMPFLTEELWQRLPQRDNAKPSISISAAPALHPEWQSKQMESEFEQAEEFIRVCRQMKAQYNLVAQKPQIIIRTRSKEVEQIVAKFSNAIKELGNVQSVSILSDLQEVVPEGAREAVNAHAEIFMAIKDLIDIPTEIKKLESYISSKSQELEKLVKRTQNPNYDRVPDDVKQKNSQLLEQTQTEIDTSKATLEKFKTLVSTN